MTTPILRAVLPRRPSRTARFPSTLERAAALFGSTARGEERANKEPFEPDETADVPRIEAWQGVGERRCDGDADARVGGQPELDFSGKRNSDGQSFAAFGRVVRGMEVVRKIQAAPAKDQALEPPVAIRKVVRKP